MRSSALAMLQLTITASGSFLAAAAGSTPPPPPAGGPWRLAWAEEFDGTELNASRWNVYSNGTHGDLEQQLYVSDAVALQAIPRMFLGFPIINIEKQMRGLPLVFA